MILLTLSSEIHIKSPRTRGWFLRVLRENLSRKLASDAPAARLVKTWDRLYIEGGDLEAAATAATECFGIQRVDVVRAIPLTSLENLSKAVAEVAGARVKGKTFAVRVQRRGTHGWRSIDAERLMGHYLYPEAAGVDLTSPEVTIRVHVIDAMAFVVEKSLPGPDGLPLGVQGKTLTLLSGGFDSAVAAWLIMRRGSKTDFVHFLMDCAQSEHAMAVAYELCSKWGKGSAPLVHVLDFQPIKEALTRRVDSRLRQVILKQYMVEAADRLAENLLVEVLVTGESVGQVSSQTIEHLVAIDRHCSKTILRPLAGFTKQEIIAWSRRIGTHDLSARAKEVCNLAVGPVAVAARRAELDAARGAMDPGLVGRALETRKVLAVEDWGPGDPLVRVVSEPPPGVPLFRAHDRPLPETGPLALVGRSAAHVASRLHKKGREVWVVIEESPAAVAS